MLSGSRDDYKYVEKRRENGLLNMYVWKGGEERQKEKRREEQVYYSLIRTERLGLKRRR
jgi:hypothetical protein